MKKSAGILVYRQNGENLEVFLIHPGGPLFAKRDLGIWSIPKGEYDEESENPLEAAKREFKEETGFEVPSGELIELTPVRNISGKTIKAWAIKGDLDVGKLASNKFKMWGKEYPEADKGEWFPIEIARKKIAPSQASFFDELSEKLKNTQ